MALWIQEDILWLEVSVDDTVRMECLQAKNDFGCVEPYLVLVEASLVSEVKEEFAAWTVLHYEVELVFGLERKGHLDDEWTDQGL